MHQSSLNDMPVHKFIPMEKFDLIQPNEVRILYYQNPSRFYVYLRQKINSHAQFQVELQRAMENCHSISSSAQYQRYQPVVAQDNHAIWHRATILDLNSNSSEVCVYFVDVGQEENISISNIRPLPTEFVRQPAFAIPCRLYEISPLYGNERSTWRLNDPVHDEFNRLMANNASCKVCAIKEQICYDVDIDIPQVGDLGTYLCEQNLVSRINMRTTTPQNTNQPSPTQAFGRIPPGFSAIQQPLTRLLQKPIVQQSPTTPTSNDSSSDIPGLPPQEGTYIITHVYSAIEFYGYSQAREKELEAFHKHLETMYNNNTNDQSLSVHFLMDGVPCVIQQGEKYHRVVIKHRESESRVLVKLVDRGDEIIVDTSELLQLEKKYFTIPAFAQPFRLYNYDETHSTANITRKLKRLILNQRVNITPHLPMINGFYPVDMKLSDKQLVNQILLSNDIIPIISSPIKPTEVQTIKPQRINEDLPAPQKLLTAAAPPPPTTTINEQPSRFSRPQQQEESNSPVDGYPSLIPAPTRRGFSMEQNGNNNRGDRNGFGERNNDENENRRGFNNRGGGNSYSDRNNGENENRRGFNNRGGGNGFGARNNDENENRKEFNNRGGGKGFSDRNADENDNRQGFNNRGGRNGFGDRNNDENENSKGFNNRGGGSADRGTRNGFGDRNNYENRNEDNGQRRGGFNSNRGGGARNGDYQDRNNRFRNNQDEDNSNSTPRYAQRGGFNGERRDRNDGDGGFPSHRDREDGGDSGRRGGFGGGGGFQSHRDREDGGDNGRRGGFNDRGGSRGGRGGYNDRGNRSRGGRPGGFSDRTENGFRSVSDNNEPMKTFSGWPNIKPTPIRFEAGDQYIPNEIPQGPFQFVISHIEKANDFFIQLTSKETEVSDLTETLQNEYKDAPELNFQSIKTNQACLAKSSDNCWYRAVILSTGLTKIKIRFIDFGDTADVDTKTIRQLAKKFSLKPPYAYHCTLKDFENNENIITKDIIDQCVGQNFNGKIEEKSSDNEKYLLQSVNLQKLLIDTNTMPARLPCLIVYVDQDKHQFYIQDDPATMEKIKDEVANDIELSPEEIHVNSMVISTFEEDPYRAIIQEDLDENVQVYFVDYGNTNICSKSSLKKCSEQLKSYGYQAKRCCLSDLVLTDFDPVFQKLNDIPDSDQTEFSIVKKTDKDLYHVRLYINGECFNEKFSNDISLDIDDQSSTTTATTVKEQERPISATGKRNNDEILSPVGNTLTTSMNTKRQKSESENEVNSIKYHQGILSYVDKNKPCVYLQLIPESIPNLDRINALIATIVEENNHNSSYEIDDHIIAQFTEDDNYYRARVESYSSSTDCYTVYFLDYGNVDENVSKDRLYSYSNELKEIQPQAQAYTLENQLSSTWTTTIRPLINEKLNDEIEFNFLDESKSIIHLKLDNEDEIYKQPKTLTANISGTYKDCFYIHILPECDSLICEMDELVEGHPREHQQLNQWNINDLCLVFDNQQTRHFRGKILAINDDKYDVQCIDYGNVISDVLNENLYVLTDDDLRKRHPLARQCRLHGVNPKEQFQAIEEIIQHIDQTERVTITVENDQSDQCMFVMLFRANHETVNDRFIKQQIDVDIKTDMSTNSSDSAIAADGDTSNDQQVISPIGIPQAESTHQYGDTTNLTVSTINQTIDFGENDPYSSNTTIKDETDN